MPNVIQNKRIQKLFITLDSHYKATVAERPLWCFRLKTCPDTELSRTLGPHGLPYPQSVCFSNLNCFGHKRLRTLLRVLFFVAVCMLCYYSYTDIQKNHQSTHWRYVFISLIHRYVLCVHTLGPIHNVHGSAEFCYVFIIFSVVKWLSARLQ